MVDINEEGTLSYFDIPFSQETFDQFASDLELPVDGLYRLREKYQIPLPGEAQPMEIPTSTPAPTQTFTPSPIPPMGEIWLNGGCNQQYDAGMGVQILTQINQDGVITILFGNEKIKDFIDVMGNTIYNFDWRIPDTYGPNDLISVIL